MLARLPSSLPSAVFSLTRSAALSIPRLPRCARFNSTDAAQEAAPEPQPQASSDGQAEPAPKKRAIPLVDNLGGISLARKWGNNRSPRRQAQEVGVDGQQSQQQNDELRRDGQAQAGPRSLQSSRPRNGEQRNGEQRNSEQRNGEQRNGFQRYGEQRNGFQRNGEQRNSFQRNGEQRNAFQRNSEERNGIQRNSEQRNGVQRNSEQRNGGQQRRPARFDRPQLAPRQWDQNAAPPEPEEVEEPTPAPTLANAKIELGNIEDLFGPPVPVETPQQAPIASTRAVTPSQARVQRLLERTAGEYSRHVPRLFPKTDVAKLGPLGLAELTLSRHRGVKPPRRVGALDIVKKFTGKTAPTATA